METCSQERRIYTPEPRYLSAKATLSPRDSPGIAGPGETRAGCTRDIHGTDLFSTTRPRAPHRQARAREPKHRFHRVASRITPVEIVAFAFCR